MGCPPQLNLGVTMRSVIVSEYLERSHYPNSRGLHGDKNHAMPHMQTLCVPRLALVSTHDNGHLGREPSNTEGSPTGLTISEGTKQNILLQ